VNYKLFFPRASLLWPLVWADIEHGAGSLKVTGSTRDSFCLFAARSVHVAYRTQMRCKQIRSELLAFWVPYSDNYEVCSPCIWVVTYHVVSGFRSQQLSIAVCCFDVCLWNHNAGSTDRKTTLHECSRGKYSLLLDDITLCWYVFILSKTTLKSNIAITVIRLTKNIYLRSWNKYRAKGEKYDVFYYSTPWLEYCPLLSALKTMDQKCVHVAGTGSHYKHT
jgi:hypothetical protein